MQSLIPLDIDRKNSRGKIFYLPLLLGNLSHPAPFSSPSSLPYGSMSILITPSIAGSKRSSNLHCASLRLFNKAPSKSSRTWYRASFRYSYSPPPALLSYLILYPSLSSSPSLFIGATSSANRSPCDLIDSVVVVFISSS